MEERLILARERLLELTEECKQTLPGDWQDFFQKGIKFANLLIKVYDNDDTAFYKEVNKELYEDILPGNYDNSWCDPAYAVSKMGEDYGRLLCFTAAELRGGISAAFEKDTQALLIRLELLLQLYHMTERGFSEDNAAPEYALYKDVLYSFVSDYFETECERRIRHMVDPSYRFALDIIDKADTKDCSYLYRYGEYITDNELELAQYINSLGEDKIELMADTWTEGYRKGFISTGKDLSIKRSVNVRYPIGFERVMKRAVENFAKMGLKPTIYRASDTVFTGRSVYKNGFFGANPNPQFDYDHREDLALILDGQLITRRLECLEQAFITYKQQAKEHAGPAVMEVFGKKPFVPVDKNEVLKFSEEQRALDVRFRTENIRITNEYIPGEERSFTIISFPVPAIGPRFKEIFDAVVRINTLDYEKYQKIQSCIIDALNEAKYVHIKGMGVNRTELRVKLKELDDPKKQAIYENCVADVNIPVGEVFTTPVLKGTDGVLHVSRVFLNELEYKDFSLTFKDGFVTDYSCGNFEDEAANRRYIEDNVLFHHKSLPMGEAAIGTNTTAYVMGRRYGIEGLLPILIAEKTGPHFAVGDTCYSHAEDIRVFNPDGKEIVAKDNEVSALRNTQPDKAYYGCHTDVTIPYDELGLLEGVRADGSSIEIIVNGRFVLPGTEELNKAFTEG